MARIKGVPPGQAGLYVKMAYYFTRRGIAKLTGREMERMIEPLEIYAHVPVLFKGYAKLEQATARLHRLDTRLRLLAELKAATLTQCEYCIDMGSAISRRLGLTDEEILALPHYQTRVPITRAVWDRVSRSAPTFSWWLIMMTWPMFPRGPGVRSIATRSPSPLPPKTSQPGEPTRACTAPLGEV